MPVVGPSIRILVRAQQVWSIHPPKPASLEHPHGPQVVVHLVGVRTPYSVLVRDKLIGRPRPQGRALSDAGRLIAIGNDRNQQTAPAKRGEERLRQLAEPNKHYRQ